MSAPLDHAAHLLIPGLLIAAHRNDQLGMQALMRGVPPEVARRIVADLAVMAVGTLELTAHDDSDVTAWLQREALRLAAE